MDKFLLRLAHSDVLGIIVIVAATHQRAAPQRSLDSVGNYGESCP